MMRVEIIQIIEGMLGALDELVGVGGGDGRGGFDEDVKREHGSTYLMSSLALTIAVSL